uniref:Uncharacterized protein n=1 Tax=Oryza glumipatula TaxID=40148 RepID=A0A0D9ZN76_9ORYZ
MVPTSGRTRVNTIILMLNQCSMPHGVEASHRGLLLMKKIMDSARKFRNCRNKIF